jgi:hypothetical protein
MKLLMRGLMVLFIAVAVLVAIPARSTSAANDCSAAKTNSILGFKTWYAYLPTKDVTTLDNQTRCEVDLPKNGNEIQLSAIWLIALAIVDDLVRVAGILAVIFIIIGGYRFILSQGEPDAAKAGRTTIINAFIGLVIIMLTTVIINFVAHVLSK